MVATARWPAYAAGNKNNPDWHHMAKQAILQAIDFGQRVAEEEGAVLHQYFVETDQWRKVWAGEVDVVYGTKGSGKSALYSLLVAKQGELFDRGIVVVPAETPRGAPAFKDLVADPPTSEQEFVALWKLYFACLLHGVLVEYGAKDEAMRDLTKALGEARVIRNGRSLQSLLKGVVDYVKDWFRVSSLEGTLEVDPTTQLPKGITGKVVFREPSATQAEAGAISIDSLLALADKALAGVGLTAWILLDRLDVAFAESNELEKNGLKALFRAYLDMASLNRVHLKIFLRTDIWRRITEEGFREGSHITRSITIFWDQSSLLNLVVRRMLHNAPLANYYKVTAHEILSSADSQRIFLYRVFPDQVEVGANKPKTFEWMLSRTRDGTAQNAPRELIHFLNSLRDQEIRRIELGQEEAEGEVFFSRASFKSALPEVSRTRLEQTLYSEFPSLKGYMEALSKGKSTHSLHSLAEQWDLSDAEARPVAEELVEIGFFERRGTKEVPQFWVPMLYRDALQLLQGTAD